MRNVTLLTALCLTAVGCQPKSTTAMNKPITDETLQELRGYIQRDVAAGFLPESEIARSAVEVLSDAPDANALPPYAAKLTREVIAAHKEEQASWPKTTDCDRLDSAFAALERAGVVSRQDFSCCGNCGLGEIRDEMDRAAQSGTPVRGYVFYHKQDTEAAVEGNCLYLSYGAVQQGEAAAVEIGREIAASLKQQGLQVNWNESWTKRIGVRLDWKRRR